MKVFATALAIADDVGAILVLAIAYNHGLNWEAIYSATVFLLLLIGLNRARVYALWPYLLVAFWTLTDMRINLRPQFNGEFVVVVGR